MNAIKRPPEHVARAVELENIFSADQDFYIFVDNSNVLGIIREILRKTEEQNPDERALNIALLTNKFLLDIAHCSSPVGYKKTGIIHVDAAMTYINSNFLKKITVKEIAKSVGVSDVYLQKMFREQYGKTIHAIITEKRIVQAKYLLAQSDADMNTIASICGFGSYEHMAYAFKRSESCSPSAYRKKSSSKTVRFFSPQGEVKLYIRKYKRRRKKTNNYSADNKIFACLNRADKTFKSAVIPPTLSLPN